MIFDIEPFFAAPASVLELYRRLLADAGNDPVTVIYDTRRADPALLARDEAEWRAAWPEWPTWIGLPEDVTPDLLAEAENLLKDD